jgi:hypothetical protein
MIALALLLAQAVSVPGLRIQDEGVTKGSATTLDCRGAGVTCSVAGSKATLQVTATGGGGGGTSTSVGAAGVLQASDGAGAFQVYTGSACPAGKYATSTSATGALSCAQVAYSQVSGTPTAYALPDATSGVTGGIRLAGQLGGTATSPTVVAVTGAAVGISNINASGATSSATYLRGDGTWSSPPGTYVLPTSSAATLGGSKVGAGLAIDGAGVLSATYSYALPSSTAAALGGVVSPTCGAGNHYSAISNGTLTCTADSGGGYTLPSSTAAVLGGVVSPSCSAGSHYASVSNGTLQCVADAGGGYTLPTSSATTLGGVKVGANLSINAGTGVLDATYSYTLPDATSGVTGGVRLTGDLGGTATSPTVPGLATKSGTGACGANTWASTLGSGAPTCTQPAFSSLTGSATSTQLPAAGSSTLGAVKGTGTSLVCSGTNKVTGFAEDGTLQCGVDQTSAGGGGGNFVSVTVNFGAGSDSASSTITGQTWVTPSSVIVCSPSLVAGGSRSEGDEDALLEGLEAATFSRVAGVGFSVKVWAARGRAYGLFTFNCTGA